MGKRVDHPIASGPVRYTLRVPPELYGELTEFADEAGWPLHAELLHALREHARRRRREARAAREAS